MIGFGVSQISRTTLGLILSLGLLLLFVTSVSAQQREVKQLSPERMKQIQVEQLEDKYYPALKFRVLTTAGTPTVLPEGSNRWQRLEEDQLLSKGARIVTLREDTVQLKVPGVSLIELDTGTDVILEELVRKIQFGSESDIFQFGARPEASHTVELKALQGEVHNSISDRMKRKGQALKYKLRTPQSVAGVRGTTFNCAVSQVRTKCSVYEGRIRLASLNQPRFGRMLTAGHTTSVREGSSRPDTPIQLSRQQARPLSDLLRDARIKLQLEPFVGNFVVAGQEPRRVAPNRYRTEINYDEKRNLRLIGEARAREPGASIASVSIRYDGKRLPVQNHNDWSVTVQPDGLKPGQRRTLNFRIQARDDTGTASLPQFLTVDLVNRDVASPVPNNYTPGDVDVEITSIGRQDLEKARMPFHLFLDDLERGKNVLQVVGEAGGYEPVESVAYSLDRGVTWDLARGTFSWEFNLPVNLGVKQKLRPHLRAWTRDGTIGSVHEAGPFVFHPKTYSRHLSDQLRRFWQAFVNRDMEGIKRNIASRIRLEDDKSTLVLYRERLLQSLEELFSVSRDMSVSTRIRESSTGRNRANITYSLEVNGRQRGSNKHFKILGPYVYMDMKRGPDGRFLIRRITDLLTKRFMHTEGYEKISYGQGYDLTELKITPKKVGRIFFNRYGKNPGDWTLKVGNGVYTGGLLNLGSTSLASAYPLPELRSPRYSSWVYIKPGNLYALNARTDDGQLTTFFKFKDLTKESLKVQVYTIRDLPGF